MSKPSMFLRNIDGLYQILLLSFLPHWLRKSLLLSVFAGVLIYLSIYITIGNYAKHLIKNPTKQKADAALIFGNCAYLNGSPNPCLTGRVDEGLALAQQDLVSMLETSGGVDDEDKRIEAVTMEKYARSKGFQGKILL
jgi:vancomycin permeability regulator SanA